MSVVKRAGAGDDPISTFTVDKQRRSQKLVTPSSGFVQLQSGGKLSHARAPDTWSSGHSSVSRVSSVTSPAALGDETVSPPSNFRLSTGCDVRAASAAAWRCLRRRRRRRRSRGHWHIVPTNTTTFSSSRTHPTVNAILNDTVTSMSLLLPPSASRMTSVSCCRSCDFRSCDFRSCPTADIPFVRPPPSRSIAASVDGSAGGDKEERDVGCWRAVDGPVTVGR